MNSKIADLWIRVRASYWFIPSLMAATSIALSFAVVHIDERLGVAWLEEASWLFLNGPAGARALLSTVAGSMITVAGVTFSMTLLAVSHASAQYGPRLMTAFMRDRGNQLTLGTFIATFLYCLMILRTVQGAKESSSISDAFVPHFAIMFAVALAIMSVVVLIYYIHHIPQSISVANVVQRVGNDLVSGIDKLYPERIGENTTSDQSERTAAAPLDAGDPAIVKTQAAAGYLRIIDSTTLMELTIDHDLVVEILQRPGQYTIPGQPLLRVWPADKLNDDLERELVRTFSWGARRSFEQDALYPVEQLLEILGKAMSPGVNSQYTAVLCLNQFERAIASFLQRTIPAAGRVDGDGAVRIIATPIDHAEFLDEIFSPLRQFLRGDWITTRHLLKSIDKLLSMSELAGFTTILQNHRSLICEEVEAGNMCESEKRMLLQARLN